LLTPGWEADYLLVTKTQRILKRTSIAVDRCIKLAVSFADLELNPGMPVSFQVQILQEEIERECYPEQGPVQLTVPTEEFELQNWIV
jgi:hypothetical protein